jgi:hypothetical protein
LFTVKDTVYSDLKLVKRLINNQYLYEEFEDGESTVTLPNDYAAWVFEAKGSDYITFRLNDVVLRKSGTTPVNLYVVNQGSLVTTLTATPNNGKITFNTLDYTFSGFGKWIFAIDSTDVITSNSYIDPLKYDGFTVYTATGIGGTPEGADYTYSTSGNGLGFNISTFLDSSTYIDNNIDSYGSFIRAAFTYKVFQMFMHNANNKANRAQRIQMDDAVLIAELKEQSVDSVVKRYFDQMKAAKMQLSKSFDTHIHDGSDDEGTIQISTTSV